MRTALKDTYHGETARREASACSSFFVAAGVKENEIVVLSCVEWPDKPARDEGMAKLTSDPRMQFEGETPVFEGTRLIAGGFLPLL